VFSAEAVIIGSNKTTFIYTEAQEKNWYDKKHINSAGTEVSAFSNLLLVENKRTFGYHCPHA